MSAQSIPSTVDVAVVGGGVSGIYSAWRIKNDMKPTPSVAVFESSDRLGGRLLTVTPPHIPDARVELGGMRFIPNRHPWVASLVTHLGLTTVPLPSGLPKNIAYLRGKNLRIQDLDAPEKIPYNLRSTEKSAGKTLLDDVAAFAAMRALAQTIKDLLGKTITKPGDLGALTAAEWKTITKNGTWMGEPLHSLPMRYLMMQYLSNEVLDFAQDSCGYDSILHTWNAADGFPWNLSDYGPNVSYVHLKEGYDAVPNTLAKQFVDAKHTIHTDTRLASFDVSGGSVTLNLIVNGQLVPPVTAKKLILAMPRRSLELLDQTGAVLGPGNGDVQSLIRSVTPIPLFKLAICYDQAWWRGSFPNQPPPSGKSVTDLPIRQCYYWATDPKNGHGVILVYDDGTDMDYWADLRHAAASDPYPDHASVATAVSDAKEWTKHRAPKRMVREIHRQLLEMHGNPSGVPEPTTAAYRDWGDDPFGGGANFWPAHVKSYDVSDRIVQPKPTVPVYICGDAYSHSQGWVEGALETAEDMLERHLGLPKPGWKKN